MSHIKLGLFFEKIHDRLPTELIFIDILKEQFECQIFDSRYLYDQKYCQEFIQENDILLPHLFSLRVASNSKKCGHYEYYSENYRQLILQGMRIIEILSDIQKPVCCLNLRSDWYSETENFWELIPKNWYLLGGIQRGYLNENPQQEFFFNDMEINITLGNQYFSDNQIIPIRHLLSDEEISTKRIPKKYDFSVLGVFYARRKRIYQKAKTLPIRMYRIWFLHRLRKMLNRYHKRYYWSNSLLNYFFNQALRHSIISYTDGSELDMFIRKYLEIPSSYALLLCHPLARMDDYGFIENQHYIVCDEEHLGEQLQWLLNDHQMREKIVHQSFEMVSQKYSEAKVISQLKDLFSLLKENRFYGCYYQKGELIFKEEPDEK
ncbi:hypothetical protein CCZ01_05905 [Helicobacter monodelphidis]|uniref:glycosyltransferase family 1 protein n=1 Tax=Helicobacter sp. 15-1451 TaxID=2004995 RepID=UPI000DCEE0C2|nr:glycosyltransferase family 1 protein [Helicobacter sp. 15-1451]RAX57514.1 hypothetical protein CCZ01_05905 [Helicobacter sp. 15-1451]